MGIPLETHDYKICFVKECKCLGAAVELIMGPMSPSRRRRRCRLADPLAAAAGRLPPRAAHAMQPWPQIERRRGQRRRS